MGGQGQNILFFDPPLPLHQPWKPRGVAEGSEVTLPLPLPLPDPLCHPATPHLVGHVDINVLSHTEQLLQAWQVPLLHCRHHR